MMNIIEDEISLMKTEIIKNNLQKISLLCKVSTIFTVLLVLSNSILSNIPLLRIDDHISFGFIHYTLLLLFNIVVIYLIDFRKVHVKKANMKIIDLLICMYVTLFLVIAAVISIQAQEIFNQTMLYTLILLICSSVLVLKIEQIVVPVVISSCIILSGLYIQHGNSSLYKQQFIYIVSLLPIAFSISRFIFYSFNRTLKFQTELVRESHLNRKLTKKLREMNRKLELQAKLDPLTNLFNRRAFNEYVKDLEKKKNPYHLTTIMIDIDCFKLYNDTYGHNEGDNVLIKIGNVLYDIASQYGCFASRWGGEEFSILMVNQSDDIAVQICNHIKQNVYRLNIEHCSSYIDSFVTVSIGASSQYITNKSQISTCLNRADKALYNVKENGRNSYLHLHTVE